MYFVSPLSPIFFNPSRDTTGTECRYTQLFSASDEIMLQVIARSESREIVGSIVDKLTGRATEIVWKIWSMNESDKLYYHVITGLPNGFYTVVINGVESEVFKVTNNANELKNTMLVQYSCKDNRQRQDSVFWISDVQFFFDWRIPGGFKDDNWTFSVDTEQYMSADHNRYDVYSVETTQKALTVGSSIGCPIWFGELLNKIMSCTFVYIEGERFVRFEASVPESSKIIEDRRSYIFKINLFDLKVVDYEESENLVKIRRVDEATFRKVANRILTV